MVREFKVIYGGMRSVIGEPLGFHSDREAQYGNPDYEEGFEKIDLRIQYKFAPVQPMDVDEEVDTLDDSETTAPRYTLLLYEDLSH